MRELYSEPLPDLLGLAMRFDHVIRTVHAANVEQAEALIEARGIVVDVARELARKEQP